MAIQTKYITKDEFEEYFGINLSSELGTDLKAIGFLKRIENRISAYINAQFYRDVEREYPEFTDYQKEHYKLALLEQAIYIFRNGDVSVDSGYEPDKGEIVSRATIERLTIAPNCKNELILCGLWCRKIQRGNGGNNWWLL